MELKKIDFPYKEMKLKELFYNNEVNLPNEGVVSSVVKAVLGKDFFLGEFPDDRPYIYNSLVTSVDGRIAFADDKAGPLVAKMNSRAGIGGLVDYWILNLLRGSADAILVGTKSISTEKNSGGTGHCYDGNIVDRRKELGMWPAPWRIVVTLDGRDVAFEASQFTNPSSPVFFYTTEQGVDFISKNIDRDVEVIGGFSSLEEISINKFEFNIDKAYIIVTGEKKLNNKMGMRILKEMGIEKLLVESPTITHIFMEEKMIDELFLNQSGLYIGGEGLTIGSNQNAFTTLNHPESELISIHMHSPHFIYMRYKLHY